jgi:alpha-beta hydrolase superfamily lysophospholipase
MHVHEWGANGDVPVVFWHALGPEQSGAYFADVGRGLAKAGFHVLAVDGPGFGRTPMLPAERYSLASLAQLLDELVDEHELDRPVVAGHSWGGSVAMTYAASHPDDVRALVLFDSGHLDYREVEDVDESSLPETAQGWAMRGLLEPVSPHWPVVARNEIPTLLFLATEPPHGDTNRAQIAKFEAAMPHAEIRWPPGTTHGIVEDLGPPLGDELASWLVEQGL